MKKILIKRIYKTASPQDGYRLLIDKIWPRGIKKEDAQLDEWCRNIAPSQELRKWFDHRVCRFEEFGQRYIKELGLKKDLVHHIREIAEKHKITLLYGAKDEKHNHAVILQKYLINK